MKSYEQAVAAANQKHAVSRAVWFGAKYLIMERKVFHVIGLGIPVNQEWQGSQDDLLATDWVIHE